MELVHTWRHRPVPCRHGESILEAIICFLSWGGCFMSFVFMACRQAGVTNDEKLAWVLAYQQASAS
jgi:hypothetical protein